MLTNIRNFIKDDKFRINMYDDKVDIINYSEIVDFSSDKIILKNFDRFIYVNGNNLVINKLLDTELLISGDISSLEFRR